MPRILAVLLTSAISLLPLPVVGQSTATACAAISADPERLACYDAIFRAPAGDPTALPAVVVELTQPIPARPTGRRAAAMTVSCGPSGIRVAFTFAGQLLSETSDEAAISFQVQQGGSQVRSLPVSPDNTTISFGTPRDADAFLETLEAGNNLVVRITPIRQRSIQVQFNLRDREAEILALREACAG